MFSCHLMLVLRNVLNYEISSIQTRKYPVKMSRLISVYFSSVADDDEIDLVVDSIQNRCATVRRIEHIGISGYYVYLKFSSKEAAAQGFHFLNNWKYHGTDSPSQSSPPVSACLSGREIIAKYLRLERYHEHFPEARDSAANNN